MVRVTYTENAQPIGKQITTKKPPTGTASWGDWKGGSCGSNGLQGYYAQCFADKGEYCDTIPTANPILAIPDTVGGKQVVKKVFSKGDDGYRGADVWVKSNDCIAWGDWRDQGCTEFGLRRWDSTCITSNGTPWEACDTALSTGALKLPIEVSRQKVYRSEFPNFFGKNERYASVYTIDDTKNGCGAVFDDWQPEMKSGEDSACVPLPDGNIGKRYKARCRMLVEGQGKWELCDHMKMQGANVDVNGKKLDPKFVYMEIPNTYSTQPVLAGEYVRDAVNGRFGVITVADPTCKGWWQKYGLYVIIIIGAVVVFLVVVGIIATKIGAKGAV